MKVHELKTDMDQRFADVDQRFDRMREELGQKIVAEGERTRRHFDVVSEQLRSDMQSFIGTIVDKYEQTDRRGADLDSKGTTLYAAVDDHELRLRVLERKRKG